MRKFVLRDRKGFTLVEILISLTIFSIISLVSINTFISTYRVSQQASVENVLLEDARYIMQRLTTEIRNNTIDYEEYFSRKVVQNDVPVEKVLYGKHHGRYDWQFFDGGTNPGNGREDGIGTLCQDADGDFIPYPDPDNCVTGAIGATEDNSTGQFPSNQRVGDPEEEIVQITNSICVTSDVDAGFYDFDATAVGNNNCEKVTLADSYNQPELYLINENDEIKTIIKAKAVEYEGEINDVLSLIRMEAGETVDNITKFSCSAEFPCEDLDADPDNTEPPPGDSGLYDGFAPISPLRTKITNISFLIAPLEDPRLAFSENFSDVRMQPQVTILLTVEPIDRLKSLFVRKDTQLHLQTTVTSRLQ